MSEKITVDKEALRQVLYAVNQPPGQGHFIRELQATRSLPNDDTNPINKLVREIEENNTQQPIINKNITYTAGETELMNLYLRLKGSVSTSDDPEEGIRFFTSLVDRVREERSIIAIRNR